MLNKEDRIRQIKEILKSFLPLVKEVAPWIDVTQLHVGKNLDWEQEDSTPIRLYFQPCKDKEGNIVNYKQAEYKDEIYNVLSVKINATGKVDPQIINVHCGTWSNMSDVPGWDPGDHSYYGIALMIKLNDFRPGGFVKVKPNWLSQGENPNLVYTITDVLPGGHIKVTLGNNKGNWDWPDYTLMPYKK